MLIDEVANILYLDEDNVFAYRITFHACFFYTVCSVHSLCVIIGLTHSSIFDNYAHFLELSIIIGTLLLKSYA